MAVKFDGGNGCPTGTSGSQAAVVCLEPGAAWTR